MLIPKIKIMLYIVLCLFLLSYAGCAICSKYQDIAIVANVRVTDTNIDSVVVVVNDSITGCGDHRYGSGIGSKTHGVKFPINARIQLFSQGDIWKDFFFEIPKNTILNIYPKHECKGLFI